MTERNTQRCSQPADQPDRLIEPHRGSLRRHALEHGEAIERLPTTCEVRLALKAGRNPGGGCLQTRPGGVLAGRAYGAVIGPVIVAAWGCWGI